MNTYKCIHCKGVCEINIIKDTEKATEPKIEFCPFCGMPNKDETFMSRKESGSKGL